MESSTDRGVAERLVQLSLDLADARALEILLLRVERREAGLRAGAGDEDLILGKVPSRGVVFSVGDPPGVVRNADAMR